MAELKQVLELLTVLEADGKLVGHTLPTLYDANGDITLTVRADSVATREQFIADLTGAVDEAVTVVVSEPWTEAQQAEWDALPAKEQKAIRAKNLAAQGLSEPEEPTAKARKAATKHKS